MRYDFPSSSRHWLLHSVLALALFLGLSVQAAPQFRLKASCGDVFNGWTYFRVIGSHFDDMHSAISLNIEFAVPGPATVGGGNLPYDSGWQTGSAGQDQGVLYYLWQVQDYQDGTWRDLDDIIGPNDYTSSFQSEQEYSGQACMAYGSEFRISYKNPNNFGGNATPMGPPPGGGPPVAYPPPPNWPTDKPWPPYVPGGGDVNIKYPPQTPGVPPSGTNWNVTWTFTPAPPPPTTNTVVVTNKFNGTNVVTTTTTITGGLPSGGNGTGSAADGSELLLNEISGTLMGIKDDVSAIKDGMTGLTNWGANRDLLNGQTTDTLNSQKSGGLAAGSGFVNGLAPTITSATMSGGGGAPALQFNMLGANNFTVDFDQVIAPYRSPINTARAIMAWGLAFVLAWACYVAIKEEIDFMINAKQATTAGTSVVGTNVNAASAYACAAILVAIWTAATGAMMGLYAPFAGALTVSPSSILASGGSQFSAVYGWAQSMVPIDETFIAAISYCLFRVNVSLLSQGAVVASRFVAGL